MDPVTVTLEGLAALGVTEVAVAAGARNIRLVRGALEAHGLKVWSFFEERCMGFFALGRALTTGHPVAVITTSGTAAVELAPAMVEAYYQRLPLIAVTADRPASYRGSGAPQAIEQVDLYGIYAKCYDVPSDPMPTDLDGPIQINVCLEEGSAAVPPVTFSGTRVLGYDPRATDKVRVSDVDLVLVGGLHPTQAGFISSQLLALGAPIVAEATANLTGVDHLMVTGGEKSLAELPVLKVLRIGCVPSWRWWRDLENRPEIEVTHVSDVPLTGLARDKHCRVWPLAALQCSESKHQTRSSLNLASTLHRVVMRWPLSEPAWMQHIRKAIPEGARVFLGNSLPIREWNLAVGCTEGITCFANRGTNGIDGLISTWLGVCAEAQDSWLVIGDLSTLYDLAGPWIANQLPSANRRIVIINNSGGKIFSRVKSLRDLDQQTQQVIENRHHLSFQSWAEMWGWAYRSISKPSDLNQLPDGNTVLEVMPDAKETESFWTAWSG
ncbi:MAG: hypothetical protein JNJ83_11760 [Verrucomicrobiaceae bacterium]|nr:hypothetical protein [Verrucomicrobiaceae bacterium]